MSRKALPAADLSLNDTLAALGYTTRPACPGAGYPFAASKEFLRGEAVVFIGNAGDVWRWLRRTKQIRKAA